MPPPRPPADLHSKKPRLAPLDGVWYMVARKEHHAAPVFFGSGKGTRFSSPSAKYGVTYLARTKEAAFAEKIRDQKLHLDQDDKLCIYESEIEQLELHTFKLKKGPARAIDLTGQGCAMLTARVECFTMGTANGYRISQAWARELMTHPLNAAGLIYIGNRSADLCLGLFGKKGLTGFEDAVASLDEIKSFRKHAPLAKDPSFIKWLKAAGIGRTTRL